MRLTKRLWAIHSWSGRVSGGFLGFILITGAFAVFADPLYNWESRHLHQVAATDIDFSLVPAMLDRAEQEASAGESKASLISIHMPEDPGRAIRISFFNQAERNPFDFGQPWLFRSYFFHPETGEYLGWFEDGNALSQYLRAIHVRIFASTPGRNLVGIFGFFMLISVLGGLFIVAKYLAGRSMWVIRTKKLRFASIDSHILVGVVLILPSLFFAISGVWLGLQGHLQAAFKIERPGVFEREPVLTPEEDKAISTDIGQVYAASAVAYPKLIIEMIKPSQDGQRLIEVRGKTRAMPYERVSQSIYLDKADYSVLSLHNTHQAGWGAKLFFLQEGLHFGQFWGVYSQVLYLIMGLVIGALPITGYLIYYLRARKPLKPLIFWTSVALVYAGIMAWVVKTYGIVIANAYGTPLLALFFLGLIIKWLVRSIYNVWKQRQPTPGSP